MRTCLCLVVAMGMLSVGAAAWGNGAPPPCDPPVIILPTQPTSKPATQPKTQSLPAGVVPGAIALSAALALGGLYLARRNARD
jgi:hypothetical protein